MNKFIDEAKNKAEDADDKMNEMKGRAKQKYQDMTDKESDQTDTTAT